MGESVHDNRLLGYEVGHAAREIRLRTEYPHSDPPERTDMVFAGVAAYGFRHDALALGTIIFSVEEVDPVSITRECAAEFAKGLPYGWPGDWARSTETAAAFFESEGIRGYEISSSLGLNGWVLATSVRYEPGEQAG